MVKEWDNFTKDLIIKSLGEHNSTIQQLIKVKIVKKKTSTFPFY